MTTTIDRSANGDGLIQSDWSPLSRRMTTNMGTVSKLTDRLDELDAQIASTTDIINDHLFELDGRILERADLYQERDAILDLMGGEAR